LYITLKFLYKIKQAFKQAKQANCLAYQAKQASFRCKKFQASKLRLSGLACLLNSKSDCGVEEDLRNRVVEGDGNCEEFKGDLRVCPFS
jgi:hypothetical protein